MMQMCNAYLSIACAHTQCPLRLRPASRANEWHLVLWSWCEDACKRGSVCADLRVDWVAPAGAHIAPSLSSVPAIGDVQPAVWCEDCKKKRSKSPQFTSSPSNEEPPITWMHPRYQAAYQSSDDRIDGLDVVEIGGKSGGCEEM